MTALKIFTIDAIVNTGIVVPEMFDYNHFGFEKKKIYGDLANGKDKGLLLSTEYYQYKNGNNYENLLIKEEYTYSRHTYSKGVLFVGNSTTVKWYDTDDAVGYEKSFSKSYDAQEIIDFGINRRNYLLANAKIYCVQEIPNDIYDYLDYVNAEMLTYAQGQTADLIAKIQGSVNPVKPYVTKDIANQLVYILDNVQ